MMAAFPAPDELQVTLANWMIKPFNEWGFRNVRQILPTANIGRSRTSIPLQLSLGHLEDVRFEGLDGTPTTLGAVSRLWRSMGSLCCIGEKSFGSFTITALLPPCSISSFR